MKVLTAHRARGTFCPYWEQGIKLLLIDTQRPHIHFADEIFTRDKRLNYESINIDNSIIIGSKNSREFLENMGIKRNCIYSES